MSTVQGMTGEQLAFELGRMQGHWEAMEALMQAGLEAIDARLAQIIKPVPGSDPEVTA